MAFDDSCFCRKSAHSVAILAQVASSPQAARPALCLLSVLAAQLWLTMVFGKLTTAGAAAAAMLYHKNKKEGGKEGKEGNATAGNSSGATGYAPVMGAGYAGGAGYGGGSPHAVGASSPQWSSEYGGGSPHAFGASS